MLVLSRRKDESVVIGEGRFQGRVMVVEVRGDKVRLGFDFDQSIPIHRSEVHKRMQSSTVTETESPVVVTQ